MTLQRPRAAAIYDPVSMTVRIHLIRDDGVGHHEVAAMPSEDASPDPDWVDQTPGLEVPVMLRLPAAEAMAVRDALLEAFPLEQDRIDKMIAKSPIVDALAHERARVDRMLDRLLPPPTPT